MSGRLWVARHAPAITTDTCYGRADVATRVPSGLAASLLAESFPGLARPAVVWSSPMSRCLDVAAQLATHFGACHRVDPSLHELDFGAWDGRPWRAIQRDDGERYARWLAEWQHVAPPGGERPADIEQRVRAWYGALEHRHAHVLVAHAGAIRALRVVSEGRSWLDAMEIPAIHLAWCEFSLSPERHACVTRSRPANSG